MAEDPAADAAANDQLLKHNGKEYRAVREGRASILIPPAQEAASKAPPRWQPKNNEQPQSVFYNPIQQFNRDLTVLAIRAYGEHVLAVKKERAEKRKQKSAQKKELLIKGKKRKRDDDEEPIDSEPKENGTGIDSNITLNENKKQKTGDGEGARAEAPTEAAVDAEGNTASPTRIESPGNDQFAGSEPEPPRFTILDALSATGLRALRFASEIPFVTCVVANDLSPSAVESMKTNIEYNGREKVIRPNIGDARAYMYSLITPPTSNRIAASIGKFDVIDLDPYGSAAPFMDSAVQAVKDGGLLCVTCTDAAVWASNGYPEKAFALYGGVPIKGYHSHEGGLRLILHGLATSGAKYGLAIEPLLSLSVDFYARIFVRVHKSPAAVKFLAANTMMVYNCDSGCGAWSTQPVAQMKTKLDKKGNPFYHYGFAQGPSSNAHCEHCGFRTHLGGPMWAGPLHNPHFIQKILDMLPGADRGIYQTVDRIEGMLITALEEDLYLSPATDEVPAAGDSSTNGKGDDDLPDYRSAIIPRTDPVAREPHPFYFHLSAISKVLHTQTISVDAFRGAIQHLGYRSTRSHTKPNTIRTDAPWAVVWEIMREWVRQKYPIKEGVLRPGSAGAAIMKNSRADPKKLADSQDVSADDQWLGMLKKDVLSAVDSARDVGDLTTKIEAALYRSGSRVGSTPTSVQKVVDRFSINKPQTEDLEVSKPSAEDKGPCQQPSAASSCRPHPSALDVVFDEALGRQASAAHTKKRLIRYQINPRANWGPLSRAVGSTKTQMSFRCTL